MRKLAVVVLVLLLLLPPATSSAASPPYPTPIPSGDHAQNGTANNTTNATLGAVIPPRASVSSFGHDEGSWGDLSEASTTTGVWAKTIGKDGEIELRWNDNGTIHKILINLVGFKGSTKVAKPAKDINTSIYISKEPVYNLTNTSKVDYYKNVTKNKTTKVPSEISVFGYIGIIPVTVLWQAYPLQMKESVTWSSTSLTSASYLIKIDSSHVKISNTTLGFLKDGIETGLGLVPPSMVDGDNRTMDLNWSLTQIKADQWTLDINWTYPQWASAPYLLDPTISFDGTTFDIDDTDWEIKTYQQLWPLTNGENLQYSGGYMTADSDTSSDSVTFEKVLAEPLDFSDLSDLTISVSTTNADAEWTFYLVLCSGGEIDYSNRWIGSKWNSGDVTATWTISNLDTEIVGSPDMSVINYLNINFYTPDTALAGDVICQVKDLKFTTSVKTSNLYDSTGRLVLAEDDFEGDDGLSWPDYNPLGDPSIGYSDGGTSLIEIDTAQYNSGSSSAHLYCDGTNQAVSTLGIPHMYDYGRVKYMVREDDISTGSWLELDLKSGSNYCVGMYVGSTTGKIRIMYGNGVGGNNNVYVVLAADTWYEVWIDVDLTNDKYRVWVDGVMYPGPNANAQGFDNFYADKTADYLDGMTVWARPGSSQARNWWLDELTFYTGLEDFSALSNPHDPDEMTEATAPTNTDYGRQTWDGDWAAYGSTQTAFGVDNTDVIIGTNSLKRSGTSIPITGKWGMTYNFDTGVDLSDMLYIRFYMKVTDDQISRFPTLHLVDASYYRYVTMALPSEPTKWNLIEIDISDINSWAGNGDIDVTAVTSLLFYVQQTATDDNDMWADGFHFYGDPKTGVCFQGNSLDLNDNALTAHDITLYDLNKLLDTGSGEGHFNQTMTSADSICGIEFTDVADSGIDSNNDMDWTVRGYDSTHRVWWTVVGNGSFTNAWDAEQTKPDVTRIFHNVTFRSGKTAHYRYGTLAMDNATWDGFTPYLRLTLVPTYAIHVHIINQIAVGVMASTNNIVMRYFYADDSPGAQRSVYIENAFLFTLINSNVPTHVDEFWTQVDGGVIISKNHANTSTYLIKTYPTIGEGDLSGIPAEYRWGDGADVEVMDSSTFNIDVDGTLANGTWTNTGTASVNIETTINLTMLNSAHDPADFTIAGTGLLLDRNFTVPGDSLSGYSLTLAPTNSTTAFSWTPIWLYTDTTGTRTNTSWRTDWGDEDVDESVTHTYASTGSYTVEVGSWLDPDWTTTTFSISITRSGGGGGGGDSPTVDFKVYDTLWGLHFVPSTRSPYTALNYTWIFGDGHNSNSRTPTHYYRKAGNYSVTLQVEFEKGGTHQFTKDIMVGDRSTLQNLVHAVELSEDGLMLWIGSDNIVWPEIGLFIGGVALIANAWISGSDAKRYRRRGIPDRMRGWRMVQYLGGFAMIFIVLWIELVIKSGMVV